MKNSVLNVLSSILIKIGTALVGLGRSLEKNEDEKDSKTVSKEKKPLPNCTRVEPTSHNKEKKKSLCDSVVNQSKLDKEEAKKEKSEQTPKVDSAVQKDATEESAEKKGECEKSTFVEKKGEKEESHESKQKITRKVYFGCPNGDTQSFIYLSEEREDDSQFLGEEIKPGIFNFSIINVERIKSWDVSVAIDTVGEVSKEEAKNFETKEFGTAEEYENSKGRKRWKITKKAKIKFIK